MYGGKSIGLKWGGHVWWQVYRIEGGVWMYGGKSIGLKVGWACFEASLSD